MRKMLADTTLAKLAS